MNTYAHPNAPGSDLDDEIDAFAARDHEPRIIGRIIVDTAPVPGTFEHDLATALIDVRNALTVRSTKREPLFQDVAELFECEYPPTQWQVTGLITSRGTALLGAEPKIGKTWIATEVAVGVATGTPVFGEFETMQGRVAYFYAEDLKVQVRNRVRALLAGRGISPTDIAGRLFVRSRGAFLDITRDEDVAWLVASCRRLGSVDLLILDPLRDLHGGEEDKSDSMRDVMRRVRLVGELVGCTIGLAHHAHKAGGDTSKRRPGQRMRGSSAIHGSTDSGLYLSDRGGDGVSRFEIECDSEVKGARSAGAFDLVLEIQDDANGEAVRAEWTFARRQPKAKRNTGNADDEKALAFVRSLAVRGIYLSRRALRDHDERPIPEKRMRDALDRLLDAGLLELHGTAVHPLEPVAPRGEK